MNDSPEEPGPSQPLPKEPEASRGSGCAYGGLATVGALFVLPIAIAALVAAVPSGSGRSIVGGILGILPIAILVAAGIYWRKIPGFLLGIGLTIGITLVLFTGCFALVVTLSS